MLGTCRIRPVIRKRSTELHELRRAQGIDDEPVIRFVHRQCAKQLLILDELRARSREALHDEIEAISARLDAVVIDRRAQHETTAGITSVQAQQLVLRWKIDTRPRRVVGDAYDRCYSTAMFEKLLDGNAQETELPVTAEYAPIGIEARDDDGLVERSSIGTADEGRQALGFRGNETVSVEATCWSRSRRVRNIDRHDRRRSERPMITVNPASFSPAARRAMRRSMNELSGVYCV